MTSPDNTYQRGLDTVRWVMGENSPDGLLQLGESAPELARYAIESFGELYGNSALELKTRELVTVAALTVLGYALPQLKVHVKAALGVGASRQEIIQIITQMYAYGGFPAALNARTCGCPRTTCGCLTAKCWVSMWARCAPMIRRGL